MPEARAAIKKIRLKFKPCLPKSQTFRISFRPKRFMNVSRRLQ